MNRFFRIAKITLAALCAIIVALGLIGFWMGYQAQETEEMMRSYEWIHNNRCSTKVRALPDPKERFQFAVLGDIQVGTAQLPRLMEALKEEGPVSFIVQTGDAVSHADSGHYKLFLNELARSNLRSPMFVLPGNHDVRNDHEKLFERYFGSKRLSFVYGGALFILLDNALGPPDDAQYDWLEALLEKHENGARNIFLFLHVQPIHWKGDGKKPVEHLYERLFVLLKEYDVDYVFSGNWHGYHREKRDGAIFVINGRGGDFDHDDRLTPCYFTLIEIGPDSVQDRRIELPPRLGVVIESLLKDWFTAHIGEFTVKNRFIATCLLLLLGGSCVLLIVGATRPKTERPE